MGLTFERLLRSVLKIMIIPPACSGSSLAPNPAPDSVQVLNQSRRTM
jgi:hypothetical protein